MGNKTGITPFYVEFHVTLYLQKKKNGANNSRTHSKGQKNTK